MVTTFLKKMAGFTFKVTKNTAVVKSESSVTRIGVLQNGLISLSNADKGLVDL
ncbi:hypothetical protein [Peribacillus simplex]|uniref:hypothetical protein n=1 Tax=Peribacillus simplex TaxID=1478 RepID=UPI001625794F|nr:hypothetical protein [Peribacillus simplex]